MSQPIDWEKFQTLTTEEQAKLAHECPFKEKGDLILHSHDPQALTRSFSQEEFYLLVREMDAQERGEVVRYASVPQLLFCSDVECWKSEYIQAKPFIGWLETLNAAGPESVMKWFAVMDYEMIVTGLKKIIQVVKPEREWPADEILGDTPYFTLDDFYYVAVSEEDLQTVKRALEVLYENDKGKYFAYLEGVMAEIDDPLEEEAYHHREVRLAERGFPDIERAHVIYSPITREEFENFPPKSQADKLKTSSEETSGALPSYLMRWTEERIFLDDVLAHLQGEDLTVLEGIHEELAWITNKILTTQGLDFSSEEKVRRGIERARHFVSVGLELLSGRDTVKAAGILKEKWLENIFRWAVTRMSALRSRAETFLRAYWPHPKEAFFLFMNPPYQCLFRGLLRAVPQCYDGEIKGTEFPLRDFRTAEDLERSDLSLKTIEAFFRHFYSRFPRLIRSIEVGDEDVRFETTLFTLLGTIFAQAALEKNTYPHPNPLPEGEGARREDPSPGGSSNKKKNPSPYWGEGRVRGLDAKDLQKFLSAAFEEKGSRKVLKAEVKTAFLEGFYKPDERKKCSAVWNFVFEALEQELGGLESDKPAELRYVACVLKRRSRGKA